MRFYRIVTIFVLVFVQALSALAHDGPHEADGHTDASKVLGEITFPTTTESAEAQAAFIEGMKLLHLFEYPIASNAFQEAQRLDPDFAMAYWGEAMTHNGPVWDMQFIDRGVAVLNKFAPTPEERQARLSTDLERDYFAALEILYGEGTKPERDARYLRHMQAMAERYPDDHEVQLFYALALLGVTGGIRDITNYMESTAISQRVFYANRQHPGAAHYLIHGVDDPTHAPLGLEAARALYRMAPDAGHSLHMTSHIFNALGMWTDSIEANINATRVASEERGEEIYVGHYPSWLTYAYVQNGESEKALEWLQRAYQQTTDSGETAAGNPWDINITHGLALLPDTAYELSFRARASVPRSIETGLGLAHHPWTNVKEKVDLSTEWQRFSTSLTTDGFGDDNSSVFFFMGAEKGDVHIDDVRLVIEGETSNLVTNESFDDGLTGWLESGVTESSTEGNFYQVGVVPTNLAKLLGEGNRVLGMINMWSQYLLETRGRDSELLEWQFNTGGAYRAEMAIHYTKGMLERDPQTIEVHLRKYRELVEEAAARTAETGEQPARLELVFDHVAIFDIQLQAALARSRGDLSAAVELAREADRLEGLMPYSFGPPTVTYPSAELLGELLLEAGDYAGAAAAFQEELKRARNRRQAEEGLLMAEAKIRGSAD
jgi:tetratricopeptide (TPR) repeat protein